MPVLHLNKWTYRYTFGGVVGASFFLVFFSPNVVIKFQGESLSGTLNIWGWEHFANIALYLENGTCTR